MFMTPLHDPIRNIVYPAQSDDLHSPIVDGEWILRDRVGLGQDMAGLTATMGPAAETMWAGTPKGKWAQRTIDALLPESFPPLRT